VSSSSQWPPTSDGRSGRRRRSWSVGWPWAVGLVILALAIGLFAGGHTGWMPSFVRSAFTNQTTQDQQMESILGLIQKDYYRKLTARQLESTSLEGAVEGLNDPYSEYVPPSQDQQFEQETYGQVSGIGVTVSAHKAGGLTVDLVFPGGPAAKAKLQEGDVITGVNGKSVLKLSIDKASALIRGKTGSKLTLTFTRAKRSHTVSLTRAEVSEPVAFSKLLTYKGKKMGFIVFSQFTQGSASQLKTQVLKMLKGGAEAIILDLQDNGGGLVTDAVESASLFIRSGTIVTTRGRNQPTTVYNAVGGTIAPTIPLAVLVNRDTASAAEILTAALQQRRAAQVIGTRTYGKGVFQESQEVAGGGILKITVGEFFTPNGTNLGGAGVAQGKDLIRGPGIKPNYYVAGDGPQALAKAKVVLASEIK
jgi:carboxyl-terminal processing protease